MTTEQAGTESRILEAAKVIFYEKGMGGARMEEIAEAAGINKAMLHYYFRSKEKLFQRIFIEAIQQLAPQFARILQVDEPFKDKLTHFVDFYVDMLLERPYMPLFVLSALQQNPDAFFEELFSHLRMPVQASVQQVFTQLQAMMDLGEIRRMDPRHLITNLMSMLVFPFVASPLITKVLGADPDTYKQFLLERKKVVADFMLHALRPE